MLKLRIMLRKQNGDCTATRDVRLHLHVVERQEGFEGLGFGFRVLPAPCRVSGGVLVRLPPCPARRQRRTATCPCSFKSIQNMFQNPCQPCHRCREGKFVTCVYRTCPLGAAASRSSRTRADKSRRRDQQTCLQAHRDQPSRSICLVSRWAFREMRTRRSVL